MVIQFWTDGCCLKNPGGAGGWAFVAVRRGNLVGEFSGSSDSTTNNRMELQAVIEALVEGAKGDYGQTEVISDSLYVVRGVQIWRKHWKEKGWRKGGRPIPNAKSWKQLDRLIEQYPHKLRFRWVRGHAGAQFNEMADRLAGREARCHV